MKADIIVAGGGASGLMAAYSAARRAADMDCPIQVTVLEKMPRPARKIMITGKGRCNFTNVKEWNEFSGHIRSNPSFVKSSFYALTPERLLDFFDGFGMPNVVERGDRAFPESHRASDVVDALVNACLSVGVRIECESEISTVEQRPGGDFSLTLSDGGNWLCKSLVIATGGMSYPGTGSTGDGYVFASGFGHSVTNLFPSLTALVPRGYKMTENKDLHIDRSTSLSELGSKLNGIQLKNIQLSLYIQGDEVQSEFGDVDFTDGGIEGPLGFQLSRKAVKSLVNGSKVTVGLDMKPGVSLTELTQRVKQLWQEVDKDSRSVRLREKEKCRILLGKLMPWDLIPPFVALHPEIMTLERRSRTETKLWVNLPSIAKALKDTRFDIAGYVGWERAVVTAGGVSLDEVVSKTMESRKIQGLYFCGEVLDIDSDTGGYNLHTAFCTGALAGTSAANSFCRQPRI